MWICLNNAFLSIVKKECGPNELLVRARRAGDIERVFPEAKVVKSPGTDYLFRAVLPSARVGDALAALAEGVDYPNFKGSVRDDRLHSAYNAFWGIHARLQPTPPYSGRRTPARGQRRLALGS